MIKFFYYLRVTVYLPSFCLVKSHNSPALATTSPIMYITLQIKNQYVITAGNATLHVQYFLLGGPIVSSRSKGTSANSHKKANASPDIIPNKKIRSSSLLSIITINSFTYIYLKSFYKNYSSSYSTKERQ